MSFITNQISDIINMFYKNQNQIKCILYQISHNIFKITDIVRWMTQVKKKLLHPRGTKVVIYHLVGNFMLNSMQNVVSLATCAESF